MIATRTLQIIYHLAPAVSADTIPLNAISWIATALASNGQQNGLRQARDGLEGYRGQTQRVCL